MPSCTGVRPHDFDSTSSDSTWSQQTGPKELEVCVCVCGGVFFVFFVFLKNPLVKANRVWCYYSYLKPLCPVAMKLNLGN